MAMGKIYQAKRPVPVIVKTRKQVAGKKHKKLRNMALKIRSALWEKKFLTINVALATLTNTGSVKGSVTNVPQGDGDSTRDGDRISCRSLEVFAYINTDPSVTAAFAANNALIRYVIFQWYPTTVPVYTDVFGGGLSTTSRAPMAPYNHDNRQLFRFLYDKIFVLNPSSANSSIIIHKKIINIPQKNIQYASGSTQGTNEIYYMVICDGIALTANPTHTGIYKFNYSDI